MNRVEKINAIMRMTTNQVRVVADPHKAFILIMSNVARRRQGLPLFLFELGGELKKQVSSGLDRIMVKRTKVVT